MMFLFFFFRSFHFIFIGCSNGNYITATSTWGTCYTGKLFIYCSQIERRVIAVSMRPASTASICFNCIPTICRFYLWCLGKVSLCPPHSSVCHLWFNIISSQSSSRWPTDIVICNSDPYSEFVITLTRFLLNSLSFPRFFFLYAYMWCDALLGIYKLQ